MNVRVAAVNEKWEPIVAATLEAVEASTKNILQTQTTDAGGICTFTDLDETETPFYFRVRVTRVDIGVVSLQLLVV